MIRRTLKSGLLATVAVLALLPAAAGAAPASAVAPYPVPGAIAQHHVRHTYPAPYRLHHRGHAGHWTSYRLVRRATGRVTTRHVRLNVRSGPGTGYRVIGHRHAGRLVGLTCKTRGSWVAGNRIWYRLAHHGGYVSARYVRADRVLPWC
ncbi:SH3 domain-containing protein [Streptomyces sp. FXJ1.172]|uniref:SH3 domain-containing protein n=1 Tax=Streptomyces sp. FXJ1.172 TaxID=710705 RepID=UPI0007D00F24|nr:SH3 domain-containing protein [Streptomyces sp. FXJ1.172]WEO99310.1 SH3 domain-containing protein [Streptomyces sp. FXJ1.172]